MSYSLEISKANSQITTISLNFCNDVGSSIEAAVNDYPDHSTFKAKPMTILSLSTTALILLFILSPFCSHLFDLSTLLFPHRSF